MTLLRATQPSNAALEKLLTEPVSTVVSAMQFLKTPSETDSMPLPIVALVTAAQSLNAYAPSDFTESGILISVGVFPPLMLPNAVSAIQPSNA